jgi:RimJ/RimL family protein N-acetyltransferase
MRLETERLILRPWEDRDRAPLARILGDPDVRRFYPAPATPAEVEATIDSCIARTARDGFCFAAAELKADGKLVGFIGLGRLSETMRTVIASEVEIGWQTDKAYWGRGLAPEAARAWLGYAWDVLKLPEVVAFTFEGNRPSRRVMEKIGMAHDPAGDFLNPNLPEGHRLRPHVLYRITNPERS